MDNDFVRLESLRVAMHTHNGRSHMDIIEAAHAYYKFMMGDYDAAKKVAVEGGVQFQHQERVSSPSWEGKI